MSNVTLNVFCITTESGKIKITLEIEAPIMPTMSAINDHIRKVLLDVCDNVKIIQ